MTNQRHEVSQSKFNGMSRAERRKLQRKAGGFKSKSARKFFKEIRSDKNDR